MKDTAAQGSDTRHCHSGSAGPGIGVSSPVANLPGSGSVAVTRLATLTSLTSIRPPSPLHAVSYNQVKHTSIQRIRLKNSMFVE